jgi:hypothetical protein
VDTPFAGMTGVLRDVSGSMVRRNGAPKIRRQRRLG